MIEKDLLAKTLYLEAGNQPFEGKCAIAIVILERVKDKRWPNTIREVILQPHQFSCWNGRDPETTLILPNKSFQDCDRIARMIYIGTFERYIGPAWVGFNHYYNPDLCQPAWASVMCERAQIGNHIFGKIV